MALSNVNGLAAGSAPELGFCAQGRHVLCRETWLTGDAATARSATRSCRGCAGPRPGSAPRGPGPTAAPPRPGGLTLPRGPAATRHGLPAYFGQQPAPGGAVRQPHTRPGGGAAAPVAGFHSRTVPSPLALAGSLPSGLNATPGTPLRAPVRMGAPTRWPVAGFHSRTVPLESLLASSLPSGLNATADTPPRIGGSTTTAGPHTPGAE